MLCKRNISVKELKSGDMFKLEITFCRCNAYIEFFSHSKVTVSTLYNQSMVWHGMLYSSNIPTLSIPTDSCVSLLWREGEEGFVRWGTLRTPSLEMSVEEDGKRSFSACNRNRLSVQTRSHTLEIRSTKSSALNSLPFLKHKKKPKHQKLNKSVGENTSTNSPPTLLIHKAAS